MARKREPRAVRRILRAAMLESGSAYRQAVACTVEGFPGNSHWADFARVVAGAHVLAGLHGLAAGTRQARALGALAPNGERFQRIKSEFGVGDFEEAVAAFEGRVPRLRAEVDRLVREGWLIAETTLNGERASVMRSLAAKSTIVNRIMSGSFFVTGVDKATLIDLRALVASAIRGDVDRETIQTLPEWLDLADLTAARTLTRARLETIYRNNVNAAFNDGQAAILGDSEVQRVIPLMELDEIRDRRTRGNPSGLYPNRGFHWQMDGFVGTAEDFDRLGIRPPNGHQCRAGLRGIPVSESTRRGFIDAEGNLDRAAIAAHNGERMSIIESGQYPDPGFA